MIKKVALNFISFANGISVIWMEIYCISDAIWMTIPSSLKEFTTKTTPTEEQLRASLI